jgi:hypothetical protein
MHHPVRENNWTSFHVPVSVQLLHQATVRGHTIRSFVDPRGSEMIALNAHTAR